MAEQTVNYQCLSCGAPLIFNARTQMLDCSFCGSSFTAEQVEKALEEKNKKASAAGQNASDSNAYWGEGSEGMKTYSCSACGAELICDVNTAATCCPYCGNQAVVPGQFSGGIKPDFVIPFRTAKEQAVAALKEHYRHKALLPRSFAGGNHIEDIQGVYVPFWMFDASTDGTVVFDATHESSVKIGKQETVTIKHYDAVRTGSMSFRKVPADASRRMPDEHMDSIEPYDYNDLRPFSMAYMPGFLADKYDVEQDECFARVEDRCKDSTVDAMKRTVTGYTNVKLKNEGLSVSNEGVHYGLLPVWLLATRWRDKGFLFAMNGQSGKMIGDLPVDKLKTVLISIILFVPLMLLGLYISTQMEASSNLSAMLIFAGPAFITAVIVGILIAQMKSVRTPNADVYETEEGLSLRAKSDTYVRTERHTRYVGGDD